MSSALHLRSRPEGGEPQGPSEAKVVTLLAPRRILFLVHGYNNTEPVADRAFAAFEDIQRELGGMAGGQDYALGWEVVRVYWAGDADWSIASALFYMGAVTNAKATGQILAGLIGRLGGRDRGQGGAEGNLAEIAFVAHSLGCRVVLETLRNMRDLECSARVERAVFFAAAVPVFKLERAGGDNLADAADGIFNEWLSLFSESDTVLGTSFPLGQTLASGNEGLFPTALGYTLWASPRTTAVLSQAENRGAGHGDYWGWDPKTRETNGHFANYHARSTLRLEPPPANRETGSRSPVVRSLEAREIGIRRREERETALPPAYV